MKTKWRYKRVMLTSLIVVLLVSIGAGWHFRAATLQAANEKAKREKHLAEIQQQNDALKAQISRGQSTLDAYKQLGYLSLREKALLKDKPDAYETQLAEIKQKREELLKRIKAISMEFSPPLVRRTSWNGQTDPDSLWHDQRRGANQTLMQNGLPSLEGKGAYPDTVTPGRSVPARK